MSFFKGFFPPLPFGLGLLDVLIVAVIIFYAWEGYRLGFIAALLDLFSFIASFLLALKLYSGVGVLLTSLTKMPVGFANALGFFLVAFIIEILLSLLLRRLLIHFNPVFKSASFLKGFTGLDHYLGIIPGVVSSLIILSFAFSLIVSLPSSPYIKKEIASSSIGGKLVGQTANVEKALNGIFGGALHDTLTFKTVEPQSSETLNLHFKVANSKVDEQAEKAMLQLVNKERTSRGIKPLVMDEALTTLARSYSTDMFRRGYFSHYTPEGLSPFDRMERADITFQAAGENLALAPSTELAMDGLMNSPGHKANILSEQFGRIGIGAMQGGIYGIMYTQEFTD